MERLENKNSSVSGHRLQVASHKSQVVVHSPQSTVHIMRPATNACVLLIFALCILNFTGCAGLKEGVKKFAGVSTRVIEEDRGQAINRTFNYDFFSCYTQTEDILKKLGVYIYAKDLKKQMIAVYVSESDTTPVGLFFKEVERNITRVEVSSPSSYAKEMIAEKLFSKLDKQLAVGEELDKKQ